MRHQIQYTCEVRSVPATNPNRFPVVFALRVTVQAAPAPLPAAPQLADPLIATLTYFRRPAPRAHDMGPFARSAARTRCP